MQKLICCCLLVYGFLIFPTTEVRGQFELVETAIELEEIQPYFGSGVSLADFDHDGWDDITVPNFSIGVDAYRNLGDGTFELIYTFYNTDEVNEVLWIDYDNDYDADLFCSVRFGPNRLYRNDGFGNFTEVSVQIRPVGVNSDSEGCTWGDYDRDGYLDLYVSNNDELVQENWLFHNDGDGTFSELTDSVGLNYGLYASLQSTWCDINMDGWQDLYISEDRSGPNKLFINYEGHFTEMGFETGTNIEFDAMSNTLGDFDRDGDFDIYVSNNVEGNALLQNDNGVFANVADLFGVAVYDCCWSGIWMDYDLDGDDDLYVAEEEFYEDDRQNNLFHNPGSGPFEAINGGGLTGDTFSTFGAGKFDFNNDFLWDFATFNVDPMTVSVWQNTSEPGNAIKIGFIGTVSNADGIGAIVHAYHNGEIHLLQTYCGENFLTQESSYEMIGLGQDTLLDSLVVTWPSGWVDRYFNLEANDFYMLTEGETFQNAISAIGPDKICLEGGSVVLDAGDYMSYSWSTSEQSQQIVVTTIGEYSVEVINEFGFQATAIFEVVNYPSEQVLFESNQTSCFGFSDGDIELLNQEAFSEIIWNEITFDSVLTNLPSGEYVIALVDTNGCNYAQSVFIPDAALLQLALDADSILCYGGFTSLTALTEGGTGDINLMWSTNTPEAAVAGNYTCLATDVFGCTSQASISIGEPTEIIAVNLTDTACYGGSVSGEVSISGGIGNYTVNWSVSDPQILYEGTYQIFVVDENNCMAEFEIQVVEFDEISVIEQIIEPNDGDNGVIELIVIGGTEPFTFDWGNGITGNPLSNVGQGIYQCSIADFNGCVFETDTLELIDAGVANYNVSFTVFPNPFHDHLLFKQDLGYCTIYDASGKLVFEGKIQASMRLDTSSWNAGVYSLQTERNSTIKLMKE